MKKVNVLALVVSGLFLWSCGSTSNSEAGSHAGDGVAEHDAHAHDHSDHAEADHHFNESSDPLELNDGARWVVNEEMKPFVNQGSELVDGYLESHDSDQSGYVGLASELREQNQLLIQNCTMTGKSHDELHKWLHPHMALVEELAGASDQAEAKQWTERLQASYSQYHQFFQ